MTILISFAIIGLVVLDLGTFFDNGGRKHKNLKGEMTGLGIFGTFLGIVMGLWDFNVDDISGSIPPLLAGLKTAFLTSIVGIFSSVICAIIQGIWPSKFAQTEQSSTDKLTHVLTTMEETLDRLTVTNGEMVAETVKMRTDLRESLEALSKGASDQIIAALEQVIREFNENLTEQFGENFAKLNEACERLVHWQDENKEAMERSADELRRIYDLFETSNAALTSWVDRAKELNDALLKGQTSISYMQSLMEQMDESGYRLGESLEKVDGMLEAGAERFEAVATQFDAIGERTDSIHKGQRQMQHEMVDSLRLVREGIEGTTAQAGLMLDRAREGVTLTDSHIEKAHKNLEDALTSLTGNFGRSYQQYLEGLRRFSEALEIADERRKR